MIRHCYIASPFFNPAQRAVVERIEACCSAAGFEFFSPMRHGVTLKDLDPEQRRLAAQGVFNMNVQGILKAGLIVAVIDGRDTGVAWEVGFAFANRRPIVSYTDEGHGLNVMLTHCVKAHARGMDQLAAIMLQIANREPISEEHKRFEAAT